TRSGGKSTESKGKWVAIGTLDRLPCSSRFSNTLGSAVGIDIFHWVKMTISLSMPTTRTPSRTPDSCIGSGGSPSTELSSLVRSIIHRVTASVLSSGSSRLSRKLLGDTDTLPVIDCCGMSADIEGDIELLTIDDDDCFPVVAPSTVGVRS